MRKMKTGAMTMLALTLCFGMAQAQPLPSESPSLAPVYRTLVGHIGTPAVSGDATDAAQPIVFKSKVAPIYPQEEECEGLTGKILLQITIAEDGDPIDIKIAVSSRSRHLDASAMDAAKQWKFEPTLRNGKAIRRVIRVPVEFGPPGRCALIDDSDLAVPVGQH